ncbi:MAG: hypothetical protein K0U74_10250 [Alphaproteobacteria bacterium]|nr:hypothetical protein [Alphaproteobacteria bacterium]
MTRSRFNRRFGRHRIEIAAAIALTVFALTLLAITAVSQDSVDAAKNSLYFETPGVSAPPARNVAYGKL